MWILIDAVDYYSVNQQLIRRGIESITPCLNLFAIPDTPRNRRIATFLALQDRCTVEESVGLDRVLENFATEHPKRISKMS